MGTRRELLAAGLSTGVAAVLGKVVPRLRAESRAVTGTSSGVDNHQVESREPAKLLSHWKLNGNSQDSVGTHHGEAFDVQFVQGRDGQQSAAAQFDGKNSFIQVPDHEQFHFETQ